ncbi:MAG: hypothetical protein ACRDOZ_12325 [Nocardioides sp.]
MRRLFTALVLPLSLLLFAPAAPAQAASVGFTDPAGDGAAGPRLDITDGVLRNRDHRIVVETSYARVSRGDLIVFLQARGTTGSVRAVSLHHPAGEDDNFLLNRAGERQDCAGLRVTWDAEADTSLVSLPSRCFRGGDYGAVRTKVLTEIGADADLAPNGPKGGFAWTDWAARG